jgi:hypothetical protein
MIAARSAGSLASCTIILLPGTSALGSAIQCLRRPHDVRGGERSRVVEARLRARLAADQAAMLRTGTVLIERVTRATAFLVQALAARELIFSARHDGEQQGAEKKAGARSTPA